MAASITHLGHTGIAIKTPSTQIIIDPNFSRHCVLLKRQDEVFVDAPLIKTTAAVFITDAHPNRLDIASYKYFPLATRVFSPKGTRHILGRFIDFAYDELADADERNVGDIRIKAIASTHRGLRWSGLRYRLALHYLFTISDQTTILYATDFAGVESLKTIAANNKIDIAILPVSHVGPAIFAGKRYQNVETALQGFKNLGARMMIPNAFGAFSFSGMTTEKIVHKIREESVRESMKDRIRILAPGESLQISEALNLPPFSAPQHAPVPDPHAPASA